MRIRARCEQDIDEASEMNPKKSLLTMLRFATVLGAVSPTRRGFRWICVQRLLPCLLLGILRAEIEPVEIEGTIRTSSLDRNGKRSDPSCTEFLVRTAGDQWYMRTVPQSPRTGVHDPESITEIAHDGRDTYQLITFSPGSVEAARRSSIPIQSTNLQYAYVREGEFPTHCGSAERLVWLAFCSWKRLSNHLDVPSIRVPEGYYEDGVTVRSSHRLIAEGTLPEWFEQTAPGYVLIRNGTNTQRVYFPPPYDQGFVDFVYGTVAVTNAFGGVFPTAFTGTFFILYAAEPNAKPNRYPCVEMEARVSRLDRSRTDALEPTITSAANVYDYRFGSRVDRPAMFIEDKGEWVRRNDPDPAKVIASKRALKPYSTAASSPIRGRFALAMMLAVLLSPLLVLALKRARVIRDHITMNRKPNK